MSENEKKDEKKKSVGDKKEETEKKDSGEKVNDKKEKRKDEKDNNGIIGQAIKSGGEIVVTAIKEITGAIVSHKNEKLKVNTQKDIDELEKKLEKLNKESEEAKANKKKEEEEKEKEKQKIIEGNNIWAKEKDNVINSIFNKIRDNIPNIIKKKFNKEFESKIEENVTKIFNNDLKNNPIIKEKHSLAFKSIKNSIDIVETLNFMMVGMSGAGKSCLINALFKKEVTKEGVGIESGTQEFFLCSNPDVPWLLIYDTVGLELSNENRNLEKIKAAVLETFRKNVEDPKTSLHGIIYCIKNGTDANRIEKNEIKFIKELNDIYGESDILTIAFTQSTDENYDPQNRKEQLRKGLNEGIKIIEVFAKPKKIQFKGNQEIIVPQFGLDKLTGVMIDNSEKIIRANLKYKAKTKIINHIKNDTEKKFKEMEEKLEKNDYKINFLKELENIIKIIFGDLEYNFKDLNLNCEKLERVLSDEIEELKKKTIKKIIKEYKSEGLNELNENFSKLNRKYDRKLDDSSQNEYFYSKFNEFCEKEITEKIKKNCLVKALVIIMNKSREILSEFISCNITNEEISEQVKKNVEIIKKKRNYEEDK